MSVVKDKIVLCQTGLADFSIESVNEVPFYRRYSEFCRLFASRIPAVDFESCFAQPHENNSKKTIEWYYKAGSEAPIKLSDLKGTDKELYDQLSKQREKIVSDIREALNIANENDQKYFNAILVNCNANYLDSITYGYDNHVLFGIWGMRIKKGRQIDSVITEGVIDHRAYRITYHMQGDGKFSPFSSINRRYGHILYGDKDIPRVIPGEGCLFKEWVPEAPHGKEVKSDMVYTAICEKVEQQIDPRPVVIPKDRDGHDDLKDKFQVYFTAGDHGTLSGQTWYEKIVGETVRSNEIPIVDVHEGYRFVGWDKNPIDYVVNENVEFFALYEAVEKPYVVRFISDEHGELQGQTKFEKYANECVSSGEVPKVLPKDGYRFVGWDKNPDDYVVKEDVEFVAQYEKIEDRLWWWRFWGWGSGCLNWLLAFLLLGLIGWLLWYLLLGYQNFNFCGCDCEEIVVVHDTVPVPVPVHDPDPKPGPVLKPCDELQKSGSNLPESFVFDMGQESGSFSFEYATGNNIPDQIIIHDGENKSDKVIFQFHDVTGNGWNDRRSQDVQFNSSKILIEIIPEDNPGTYWEIKVNCPKK